MGLGSRSSSAHNFRFLRALFFIRSIDITYNDTFDHLNKPGYERPTLTHRMGTHL